MHDFVYINGEFKPTEEATISVYDRGFLFGDSVYEVIPIYSGLPFALLLHYQRLCQSLEYTFQTQSLSLIEWKQIIANLLKINQLTDESCLVYLQITRGTQIPRGHTIPSNHQPNIIAFTQPLAAVNLAEKNHDYRVVTLEDTRWLRCNIKMTSLLGNILLLEQARQRNADDVILIREGYVTESSSSNVFVIKDNTLYTPPADHQILNGITRQIVLKIAEQHQLQYSEEALSIDRLFEADEVWLTNSSREIAAVTEIDGQLISQGKPGPLSIKCLNLFQQAKPNYLTDLYEATACNDSTN